MDFKKKREAFDKRFGIIEEFNEVDEFKKFKDRMLNIFENIDLHLKEDDIVRFCTLSGKRVKKNVLARDKIRHGENIFSTLQSASDAKELYFLIETIFFLLSPIQYSFPSAKGFSRNMLYCSVKEAIEISQLDISICEVDDEIILYPRGEEVLDKGLVEEVFSFLDAGSQQHFVSAVRFYKEHNKEAYIKSAESIRRCLEEFLRVKLNNKKGLDKNIIELGKITKDDQISPELRNIIMPTYSHLDKYFNQNSKHNDGNIGEAENEFLLYQAGLLMRYISKIIR